MHGKHASRNDTRAISPAHPSLILANREASHFVRRLLTPAQNICRQLDRRNAHPALSGAKMNNHCSPDYAKASFPPPAPQDNKRSSHFSTRGETLPPTKSANANNALRASPHWIIERIPVFTVFPIVIRDNVLEITRFFEFGISARGPTFDVFEIF